LSRRRLSFRVSINVHPGLTEDSGCLAGTSSTDNFLHQVQRLCNDQGALFILDEMITGFRWHLGGAQTYFGVDPDLSTFGKGMANGFSVAAVAGKRKYMEVGSISQPGAERTFLLSTTHGGEMSGTGRIHGNGKDLPGRKCLPTIVGLRCAIARWNEPYCECLRNGKILLDGWTGNFP
jgi:hypothetical protein